MNRFEFFARKVGCNNTRTVWVLKCDIKKFFASIDHDILKEILRQYISDTKTLALLDEVIGSFQSTGQGKGLPLGNLTSQLLVNIYMNEFDQLCEAQNEREILCAVCGRFCFSFGRPWRTSSIDTNHSRLFTRTVKTRIAPAKTFPQNAFFGRGFSRVGAFPDHRVLRTATKRRMIRRIVAYPKEEIVVSYVAMLGYGNEFKLKNNLFDNCLTFAREFGSIKA